MTDWLREARALHERGEPAVLVTVAGVRGSAPRETGAKMLVTAQDSRGTIGGGDLEYQCQRIAARLLREERAGGLRRFPLGTQCGQCCGGVVDVLFEPLGLIGCLDELFDAWSERRDAVLETTLDTDGRLQKRLLAGTPPDVAQRQDVPGRGGRFCLREPLAGPAFDVAVFGAGHVGSALVRVLAGLDCSLRWIDGRRGLLPPGLPANVRAVEAPDPLREVAALPPGTYAFVMTHSHALDLALVAALLARGDTAYCGLIGSATKRRRFEQRLRAQGLGDAALRRLSCPIGIRGIDGKRPAEIAISAAAEMLRLRERRAGADSRKPATLHAISTQGR